MASISVASTDRVSTVGGGVYQCILFNSRSIKNKLNDLHQLLHCSKPAIVCITETWLNDSVPNQLLTDNSGYNIIRKDRVNNVSHGGGVAILYNAQFTALSIDIPSQFNHVELCAVDIYFDSMKPLRVFTCYRPPATSNRDTNAVSYIADLCSCIDTLMPKSGSAIVCGDFNFPTICWNSLSSALHSCTYTCSGVFIDFVLKHGFTQLVDSPTHGNNLLDLILCNDINCILNTTVCAPFSTSDHSIVLTNIVLPTRNSLEFNTHFSSDPSSFYDFKRADWDSIRAYLASYNFDVLFNSDLPVSSIFELFYDVIYLCFDLHVPTKLSKSDNTRRRRKYPPNIRKLLSKKLAAWKVYRRTREPRRLIAYKARAAACRTAINNYAIERENKLIDGGNLGAFYRYANGKLCSRSTIGPLIGHDGSTITNPPEKAELLNENFRNNFTIDNNVIRTVHPSVNQCSPTNNLSNITFTPNLIERAIKRLKTKQLAGQTKFHQYL